MSKESDGILSEIALNRLDEIELHRQMNEVLHEAAKTMRFSRNLAALYPIGMGAIWATEIATLTEAKWLIDGGIVVSALLLAAPFEIMRRRDLRQARQLAEDVIPLLEKPPELDMPSWVEREID